jgi:hypothetical protein
VYLDSVTFSNGVTADYTFDTDASDVVIAAAQSISVAGSTVAWQ